MRARRRYVSRSVSVLQDRVASLVIRGRCDDVISRLIGELGVIAPKFAEIAAPTADGSPAESADKSPKRAEAGPSVSEAPSAVVSASSADFGANTPSSMPGVKQEESRGEVAKAAAEEDEKAEEEHEQQAAVVRAAAL